MVHIEILEAEDYPPGYRNYDRKRRKHRDYERVSNKSRKVVPLDMKSLEAELDRLQNINKRRRFSRRRYRR